MRNKPALISVIIPMYNRKALFNSLWHTLKNQTYTNFEVIIVDDGSETPLELPSYFDSRCQLIRYAINKGPGFARKKGREQAKGEYISYLDSDDYWDPNFLELSITQLEESPHAAMCYSMTHIQKADKVIAKRPQQRPSNNILPDIFYHKIRPWATTSCVWRAQFSKPEFWLALRNNEDIIHDVHVAKVNNNVVFNNVSINRKNQSADDRISRNAKAIKQAVLSLLRMKGLPTYRFIDHLLFRRLYDHSIKLNISALLSVFKFVYFANNNRLLMIKKMLIFTMMSLLGIKKTSFKRYFK